MNKLILNENHLLFSPTLASLIGLKKAIFIERLNSWQQLKSLDPEANLDSFYDGDYWINTTIPELCDQLPFLSKNSSQDKKPTMKRLIRSLINLDLIEVIESEYDASFWCRVKKSSVDKLVKNVSVKKQTLKSPEPKKKFWEYKNKTGI